MNKLTVADIDIRRKTVFVRADFNVPLHEGRVADDTKIRAALPTINYLLDNEARVILASHLGRPKGKIDESLRLDPIVPVLSRLTGRKVLKVNDCTGPEARGALAALGSGEILLLENTRFFPGEKENSPEFGRELASLADVFVNDAFASSHRAHASVVGLAPHIPAVAGFLLARELEVLGGLMLDPARPFLALVGGAKVSDKLRMLRRLLELVDGLILAGGMANTFLLARGLDVGDSLVERDLVGEAADLMETARKIGKELLLPEDLVVAPEVSDEVENKVVAAGAVPTGWKALDIGPRSVESCSQALKHAATVFWNGPMGVFEVNAFAAGTMGLARVIADLDAVTVVGGGESIAALKKASVVDRITHVSTGGGAALELLEGRELPGVTCLLDSGAA